jgi:4-amino-4-deoxy-L-arabinose transferase-like glycosyltransferase
LKKLLTEKKHLTLVILIILALTLAYLAGLAGVPFHPDESTQLFMSSDLNTLFSRPADLFWSTANEQDARQIYRELDAPLARCLIGVGRTIASLPALPVDWDWSKSWEENQTAGALPDARLLLVGRLSVALLFPFSLFFIFNCGRAIGGSTMGWAAMLLLASNALVLLHTRRAMAEGGLIFTITLFLWMLTRPVKPSWLIAIAAALVFCSKQSAGVLVLVGIASVLWKGVQQKQTAQKLLINLTLYGLVFVAVTVLLNPFLWSNPIQASLAALHARQELLHNQVTALGSVRPDQVLESFPQRLFGLIAQLFINQPAVADIGNYIVQTQSADVAYFSSPFNQLLRGFIGGGVLLILSLSGFILATARSIKSNGPSQMLTLLFLLSTLLIFITLIWFLPIPWQRYYLPLVPFSCIWTAYFLSNIISLIPRFKTDIAA